MAAPYVTAVRTAMRVLPLSSGLWRSPTTAASRCFPLLAARCRPLHLSSAAAPLRSSGTEQQSRRTGEEKTKDEAEEEPEGPEYIPRRRKAKNPMIVIGYAWLIGLPTGIITFLLVRRQVDKNRLKQLKIRQRMRNSGEGNHEDSRYRRHADRVNVDQ